MDIILDANDYLPLPPKGIDFNKYGIGLIGCGEIANGAHLPAYRKAGFKLAACCDLNRDAARATADKFNIPFWTTDVEKLLEREDVVLIDLAVHPSVRMGIFRQIAKKPRPVLCQKPFASGVSDALELINLFYESGICVAINQQARWAPIHKAIRVLIDRNTIGQVYSIQHTMRSFQDNEESWYINVPYFTIIDHGIHYLDLLRYFASSPYAGNQEWQRVHCIAAMLPNQHSAYPMNYSANVDFGSGCGDGSLFANLYFNNIVRAKASHEYQWKIDGTGGSIWCANDKVYVAINAHSETIQEIRISGSWFPDAFLASMGDLIASTENRHLPSVTPEDNIMTVALAEAMILSSKRGRAVERTEVVGKHPDISNHQVSCNAPGYDALRIL